MSLDEWLRVGNQDIQEKSTGIKEKFWGLRGGMCSLSNPWLRPCKDRCEVWKIEGNANYLLHGLASYI
jgi:hypothetical protein